MLALCTEFPPLRSSCGVPRAAPSTTQLAQRGAPQESLHFAAGCAAGRGNIEEQHPGATDYVAHNASRAAISAGGRWSSQVLAIVSQRASSTRPNPDSSLRDVRPDRVGCPGTWAVPRRLCTLLSPEAFVHVSTRARKSSRPLLTKGLARSSPDLRPPPRA